MTITILILEDNDDDYDILAKAVAEDHGDPAIEIIGRVTTGAELLATVDHQPDVIIIDHHVPMSDPDGRARGLSLTLMGQLTRTFREREVSDRAAAPSCILWSTIGSADDDQLIIFSFIAYGGHNYVWKNQRAKGRAVIDTIRRTVCDGERWSPAREPLESDSDAALVSRWLRLIAMLADGQRYDKIAEVLQTTADTASKTAGLIAGAFGITSADGTYAVTVPREARRAGYLYVPYEWWPSAPDREALWPGERPHGNKKA